MAAPDFQTLYDFETQIETAVKAVLVAAGLTVFSCQDDNIVTTPRVEVQCVLGTPTGHKHIRQASETREVDDMFTFSLRVIVVTNRAENGAQHGPIRGRARYELTSEPENFGVDVLPYIELDKLDMTGNSPVTSVSKEEDLSEMAFSGTLSIRPDAWPA